MYFLLQKFRTISSNWGAFNHFFFPMDGFLMILGRIKPWWKSTSVWFMGLFCLTYKSMKMTFLMKEFFDTLEQQWYYCHPTISFQEPELYISHKNAFIRVRKPSFVRLTRRRFSIRTSKLSEEHFLEVKDVAAGSAWNSYQHFFPFNICNSTEAKNYIFVSLRFSWPLRHLSDSLVVTHQQRLNIYQRIWEQIPRAFRPRMTRKASI